MRKMFLTILFFIAAANFATAAVSTEIGRVENFGDYISQIWAWASQLIFAVSVIAMISGGAVLMFSGGNEAAAARGKSIVSGSAVSSFLVIFSAVLQSVLSDQSAEIAGVGKISDAISVAQNAGETLLATVGIISTAAVIFSGLRLIFAGGDFEKIHAAKRALKFALFGSGVSFGAFAILRFLIAPFVS